MLLEDNHPFLSTSADVVDLAKPLQKLGITYFFYTHTTTKGERTCLTTHPETLKNYYQKKYYLVGNIESHTQNYISQVLLWSTLPKQYIYDDVRLRNIDHGIYIIEPQPDGCDFFGFGTKKGNDKIINIYMTHMEILKKFTTYFKEHARSLIKLVETNKVVYPFHQDNVSFVNSFDNSIFDQAFFAENSSLPLKLTQRQRECIELLMQGKTLKQIGKVLNLSPRTIETYLNNLKKKMHCRNKMELIFKCKDFKLF